MKICSRCNIEKELSEFSNHSKTKDGLQSYCRECNKEKNKQWYLGNREKTLEKMKQYQLDNKEKYKEYQKQWCSSHPKYNKEYNKQRKQVDPLFKFTENIRSLISNSFKRKGYRKSYKTEQILGCTIEEFKNHIQSQFHPHMTFENQGDVWEIDHKIHISSAKTEGEIITLNHYTNLRPLFKTTEIAQQYGYDDIIGNRNKGASSVYI